jgi:hypothetical protein
MLLTVMYDVLNHSKYSTPEHVACPSNCLSTAHPTSGAVGSIYRVIKKSVHLMITVQKTRKYILNGSVSYHDKVVSIMNTVFENTVRRVNKCLETGRGHLEHYL